MKQPLVSRAVTELEKTGYVTKKSTGKDSRTVNIALTDKGRNLFHSILPAAQRHRDLVLRNFSHEEIETLTQLFKRVGDNLGIE